MIILTCIELRRRLTRRCTYGKKTQHSDAGRCTTRSFEDTVGNGWLQLGSRRVSVSVGREITWRLLSKAETSKLTPAPSRSPVALQAMVWWLRTPQWR